LVNLMMKINSKITSALIVLLVAGLIIPGISFATMNYNQNSRQNQEEWQKKWQGTKEQHKKWQEEKQETIRENLASKSAERNSFICDNLENWAVKIDQTLTERETKIQEKQTERLEKLNEKRENRDTKLEQYREKWEMNWEEHFGKLEEKASTSEQQQALVEFKEAIEDARASRQAAVDKVISEFRTGLDKLIADRKTAIETAKTNYINAYNAAIEKAKNSCTQGADASTIKEALKAELKAAKEKFNSDRQAIEKMDVKKLVEVRQEAFKEALDYFKKAMQAAREALRAVFGLD